MDVIGLKKQNNIELKNQTIILNSQKKMRVHDHYPAGKGGYVPVSAGLNPYSEQGKAVFYR